MPRPGFSCQAANYCRPVLSEEKQNANNCTVLSFFCWNKFGKSDLALFWHNGCCGVLPMFVFIFSVFLLGKLSDRIGQVWLSGLLHKLPLWRKSLLLCNLISIEKIFAATVCPQIFFLQNITRTVSLKSARRKILTSSGQQSFLYAKFTSHSNQRVM